MKRGQDGVLFERGDVVWGVDPFKLAPVSANTQSREGTADSTPRPWLVISEESVPLRGAISLPQPDHSNVA